jgi:copper homeostasis protein (lipoprotein)
MYAIRMPLIVFTLFIAASAAAQDTVGKHSSRKSPDWPGTYYGVLPCADCPGIQTTLRLSKGGNFAMRSVYLDRSVKAVEHSGKFRWKGKDIIVLKGEPQEYKVEANTLTQLDMNGMPVAGDSTGRFILRKSNYILLDKYWKLVELNGNPVKWEDARKEPHLTFRIKDNGVSGSAGCNSVAGTYILSGGNHISFSHMIATRMACADMSVEQAFLEALEHADSYTIKGDELILNRAGLAAPAKFKTVAPKK